jgi:hypothetical protein
VTWEGEPLPEGDIIFAPADGAGVPDAGKISAGRFAFRAAPGAKRVEIYAHREVGPPDPVMGQARRESYIPPRYNDQSILTAEVGPGGEDHFRFDLNEDG